MVGLLRLVLAILCSRRSGRRSGLKRRMPRSDISWLFCGAMCRSDHWCFLYANRLWCGATRL